MINSRVSPERYCDGGSKTDDAADEGEEKLALGGNDRLEDDDLEEEEEELEDERTDREKHLQET